MTSTRESYVTAVGSEETAVNFENWVLSTSKLLLPECACAVLDGKGDGSEYWGWLTQQYHVTQAQMHTPMGRVF